MKKQFLFVCLSISIFCQAQFKSPSDFLGYEIGTQFTRHADVISYFEYVANNSDWMLYKDYGKTYERRRLTYAIISTPENLKQIENIRKNNLAQAGLQTTGSDNDIAIVWLSYNVHGNEASSTEAAMQTLYTLLTQKTDWLKNTVVIMDPCINPDGRDRYVNWYNQVKATPYNTKQIASEHNEPWPGGRPNHYLFDLNRDWTWATQKETKQRLAIYNQWLPHIHVDFHEQGINEPYYFAPAAEPYHEVITDWQKQFQTEIGKNHARYFDRAGWLFFTRERFDLLYPSYGDTYPTYVGAIGMTYEQAGHGRAGLGIETDEGYILTLVDRVAHHTTTGLSTIEISSKNALQLNKEFKNFFNTTPKGYTHYILKGNPDKINRLKALLDLHQITYAYGTGETIKGYNYQTAKQGSINTKNALVVSTKQPKGTMVKVLFEPDAKLSTPLTYDITAWSLPYAYGLETLATSQKVSTTTTVEKTADVPFYAEKSVAGFLCRWNSMEDAQFLSTLLQSGIRVRTTEKPFKIEGNHYPSGTLVITKSDNIRNPDFESIVINAAKKWQRQLVATTTSFSESGTDFGSPDVKIINPHRIALLKGDGVSSLNFGAIWHYFEHDLHYPVTPVDTDSFNRFPWASFDVIIFPEGWYNSQLSGNNKEAFTRWIRNGGKAIVIGRALGSFTEATEFGLIYNENEDTEEDNNTLVPYAEREMDNAKNLITGSIYPITLDNTHPLAFGYESTYYTLKLGSQSFSHLKSGYNVGYINGDAKQLSGFSGAAANAKLKNSLVFGETRMGQGSLVYMVDNVLFRGFWENGKLLFANSLFMVNNDVFRL